MPGLTHALDFLETPPGEKSPPVCVLFGSERFLKLLVRKKIIATVVGGHVDGEASVTVFDGAEAQMRDVVDELSTVALFGGGGPRLAIVDDEQKFVDKNREALEAYVAKPRSTGVLVLDVETFASNTRLYKAVLPIGHIIDCRVPEITSSRAKEKPVDEARIVKWLVRWAKQRHKVQLPADVAEQMLALVGPEFGLLDCELAKLALYVPENGAIGGKLVEEVVGGWRAKTVWELNDAIADGDAAGALEQLDRLIQAGQDPQALLGIVGWSLRRYAAAVRMIIETERRGQKPDLGYILQQSGFWGDAAKKAESQLRQIGRARGRRLYRWLLETDLALKGSHSDSHSARFKLEHLIVRLSNKLTPPPPKSARPAASGGRTGG